MRVGRYNVDVGKIFKFNVYKNDAGTHFIHFEGYYQPIRKKQRYKGGWLWELDPDNKVKIQTGTKVLIKSNPRFVWIVVKHIDYQWLLLKNTNKGKSPEYTSAHINNLVEVIV